MRKYKSDCEPPLPNFSKDGDFWCALWGKDKVEGVAGFGTSPEQALANFNERWHDRRPPPVVPDDAGD